MGEGCPLAAHYSLVHGAVPGESRGRHWLDKARELLRQHYPESLHGKNLSLLTLSLKRLSLSKEAFGRTIPIWTNWGLPMLKVIPMPLKR